MSSSDIREFVQHWLEALASAGAFPASEIEQRGEKLVVKIDQDPSLQELAANPFSLTVLVLLVGLEGLETNLPRGWLRLLERYLQFCWWWETERRGRGAPMKKHDMLEILYLTSYYLQVMPPHREQIEDELTWFLRTNRAMSANSAADAAETALSFWINTGMLHHGEQNDLLYLKHTTIQEYGVAQALAILPSEMWRHTEEVYTMPQWKRPIRWAAFLRSTGDRR